MAHVISINPSPSTPSAFVATVEFGPRDVDLVPNLLTAAAEDREAVDVAALKARIAALSDEAKAEIAAEVTKK